MGTGLTTSTSDDDVLEMVPWYNLPHMRNDLCGYARSTYLSAGGNVRLFWAGLRLNHAPNGSYLSPIYRKVDFIDDDCGGGWLTQYPQLT